MDDFRELEKRKQQADDANSKVSFDDFLKMFKDGQGLDQPAVTIPYRKENDDTSTLPPLGLGIGGQQEIVAMPSGSTPDESVSMSAPPEENIISKLKALAPGISRGPALAPIQPTEHNIPQPQAPAAATDLADTQFADAQEQARQNRMNAGMQLASAQIGKGIASLGAGGKVDVDTSGQEMLAKTADAPIKDLEAGRKSEKEFLDLMDDKKKNDPKSEVSQLYRTAFKKLGVSIGEGATAAELEKASPTITAAINAQLSSEAQKLRYAEIRESKEERVSNKKAELDDKYMSKFNDTVNKFEKEKTEGDKYFDTALSLADEATKSPTAAINLARALIKSIEGAGARVSDKDIQTTLRAGGVGDNVIAQLQEAQTGTIPAFQAKDVKNLMNVMKKISDTKFGERKEQMIHRQAKLLKTTPEAIKEATFMPEAKREISSNSVKIILPNGKTGMIPRENLAEALKRGAKEI